MNSFKQITSGLSSSLFLAFGFTNVAEKLDPMLKQAGNSIATVQSGLSGRFCTMPCQFTPESGQ